MGRNAHKARFVKANVPQIFDAQNRGFSECQTPFLVLASTTETKPYYNDVTGVFLKRALSSDTVDFILEFGGEEITKFGTSVYFPGTPLAEGYVIDWRQHLADTGAGCYTVKIDAVIAGVPIQYTYGKFDLLPWNVDTAMHTVRLYSKFDSYALNYDVNFKGSGFVDSIRFNGFFGKMKPNTVVNNLASVDHLMKKTTRENNKTYELTTDLLNHCHTRRIIDLHLLHENDIYISDHNPQNHSYDYRDVSVIVDEVGEPEYKDSVRGAVLSAIFKDKKPYYQSLYMSGDPLAGITPAPSCQPANYAVEYENGTPIQSGTIPSGGSELIQVPNPIVCEDATVENSDGSYTDTVASGGTLILPDETINLVDEFGNPISTFTFPVYTDPNIDITSYCPAPADATAVLKDTLGNTLSTTNIPSGTSDDIIAPDADVENSDASYTASVESGGTLVLPDSDVNVNGNLEGTVVSVQPIDIDVTDGTNPVTPDAITISGNTVTIEVPAGGGAPVGATLMKTGQTTSYRTGDDGDIEAGRATNFTTLASNNPFGNTNRFTDELGGQTYTNNIVIDWSTYDGATVLGFRRTITTSTTWNQAIDGALLVSIGTFTSGWRLPNIVELDNLVNHSVIRALLYPPFDGIFNANQTLWSSTTNRATTTNAFQFQNNFGFARQGDKNAVLSYIPCRTFTVTGTTLT